MFLCYIVCILLLLPSNLLAKSCCSLINVNYTPQDCYDFKICNNRTVSLTCRIGQICYPPNSTTHMQQSVIMSLANNLTRHRLYSNKPSCNHSPVYVHSDGSLRCANVHNSTEYVLGLARKIDYTWIDNARLRRPFMDFNWFLKKLLEYGKNDTYHNGFLRTVIAVNGTHSPYDDVFNTTQLPQVNVTGATSASYTMPPTPVAATIDSDSYPYEEDIDGLLGTIHMVEYKNHTRKLIVCGPYKG
ncbi:Rh157.5 [macacine betaherpesvirus 3]|uniref:RhUL128 n=1 Tax=Rhesus cytomegalovirus (strain 68-1) TaxID=47929 RepID=A8D0V9_RHCM6|nr:RhUL128 [macacine betaherpesvirus 3]AGM37944.1 RhUL128 [macacine betaherpesvirus 3]QQL10802.1 Rh157.5 [Rhesus cytomegalovirus strain 68-1_FL]QQL10986.1 Rh157.5 [macacine betaherpesvirus 3]